MKRTFGSRLVGSHQGRAHQVPINRLRRLHRQDVARWALSRGSQIDRDSLAVITSTLETDSGGSIDSRWTCDRVDQVLSWRAAAWCSDHGVQLPLRVGESLSTYVTYLDANRLLEPGSDRIEALIDHIEDCAFDWGDHTPAFDSDDTPSGGSTRQPATGEAVASADTCVVIQLIPKKSNIVARPS